MNTKTSALKLISRSFSLSFKNIWRNKVLSVATIFVTATILFIFNVILAINLIAQDALRSLNEKIDLVIYVKETTDYTDVQKIVAELQTVNGVKDIKYVSKEEALAEMEATHPNISSAFEKYELGNPLPASLSISTTDPEYHKNIINFVNQDRYKAYLSSVISNNQDNNAIISGVSNNLIELTNFTRKVIFWLIITFIIGGALIILNALQITLFARKREIGIMKLVGASNWFIRSPFILEAIIYGITAVVVSFVMLFLLSKNISIKGTELWNYYGEINFIAVFAFEAMITIILSVSSSMIAVHEYVKKDFTEH